MLQLPNNCRCSEITVFPKNWKGKANVKEIWYIQYKFYDPKELDRYPKGKLCIVKGFNRVTDLKTRQGIVDSHLKTITAELLNGFNPITKNRIESKELLPSTGFIQALGIAKVKKKLSPKTLLNVTSVLKYVTEAANVLDFSNIPIEEIKRRHIRAILDHLAETRTFSNSRYNKYRTALMMLFDELVELDTIEINVVKGIKKKEEKTQIRETLSKEDRQTVVDYLEGKGMNRFALFIKLFYHSGIRLTEMMKVRGKDVNIKDQTLKCTILKGGRPSEVSKTIKNIAVNLWKEALTNCGKDDYIFSVDLLPGKNPITAAQVTRRWEIQVKQNLGFTSDLYALKHANTTEMIDENGLEAAAELNSHKSTAMTAKVYDIGRFGRNHNKIKGAGNEF